MIWQESFPSGVCEISADGKVALKAVEDHRSGMSFTAVIPRGGEVTFKVEQTKFGDGDGVFIGGATDVCPDGTGTAQAVHLFDGRLHHFENAALQPVREICIVKTLYRPSNEMLHQRSMGFSAAQLRKFGGSMVPLHDSRAEFMSDSTTGMMMISMRVNMVNRLSFCINKSEWVESDVALVGGVRGFVKMGLTGDAVRLTCTADTETVDSNASVSSATDAEVCCGGANAAIGKECASLAAELNVIVPPPHSRGEATAHALQEPITDVYMAGSSVDQPVEQLSEPSVTDAIEHQAVLIEAGMRPHEHSTPELMLENSLVGTLREIPQLLAVSVGAPLTLPASEGLVASADAVKEEPKPTESDHPIKPIPAATGGPSLKWRSATPAAASNMTSSPKCDATALQHPTQADQVKRSTTEGQRLQAACTEVVQSEGMYVRMLTTIVEQYARPLHAMAHERAGDMKFGAVEELSAVFGGAFIEALQEIHIKLLSELQAAGKSPTAIARILKHAAQNALRTYLPYVQGFGAMSAALISLRTERPEFSAMVHLIELQPSSDGLTLDALLASTIQRMPRYQLLIREILSHARAVDDTDCVSALEDALSDVEALNARTNDIIDDTIRRKETMDLLVGELRRPDLVSPSRLLLKQAILAEVVPRGNQGKSRVSRRRAALLSSRFFLFHDLLLIKGMESIRCIYLTASTILITARCFRSHQAGTISCASAKHALLPAMEALGFLSTTLEVLPAVDEDSLLLVTGTQGEHSHWTLLCCEHANGCAEWACELHRLLDEQLKTCKRRSGVESQATAEMRSAASDFAVPSPRSDVARKMPSFGVGVISVDTYNALESIGKELHIGEGIQERKPDATILATSYKEGSYIAGVDVSRMQVELHHDRESAGPSCMADCNSGLLLPDTNPSIEVQIYETQLSSSAVKRLANSFTLASAWSAQSSGPVTWPPVRDAASKTIRVLVDMLGIDSEQPRPSALATLKGSTNGSGVASTALSHIYSSLDMPRLADALHVAHDSHIAEERHIQFALFAGQMEVGMAFCDVREIAILSEGLFQGNLSIVDSCDGETLLGELSCQIWLNGAARRTLGGAEAELLVHSASAAPPSGGCCTVA